MKLRSVYEFLAGLKLGTPTITDIVTTLGNPGADTKLATEKAIRAGFEPRFTAINRYGFVSPNQTGLAFDGTDTLSLSDLSGGTGWLYMRSGILYTVVGTKGVTVSTPIADGVHYFFIDGVTGDIDRATSPWTLQDTKVPVAALLWKSACTPQYWLADERHTCLIDRMMHYYEHTVAGTQYLSGGAASGHAVAPSTPADADNVFALSTAYILDEDRSHTLTGFSKPNGTANAYVNFYRDSATTYAWARSPVPYKYTGAGYIEYDSNGTMTAASPNKYVNTFLLLTNFAGDGRFFMIPGRAQFDSLAAAQAESPKDFAWTGFPIAECIFLTHFTWETKSNYVTKGLCRLAAEPKAIKLNTVQAVISATLNHGSLAGLTNDDHPHYTRKDTLTEQGDLYYASAAATPAALAHGSAGDLLQSGGHGANPSWLSGATYAVAAKGVTNGDSHDHNGGDGAQIAYSTLSGLPTLFPVGMVTPYAGRAAPTGWLICDGSAVSRSTYADLFAAIAPSKGTFTVTIASPAVLSLSAHGLVVGDAFYITTTGALPTGMAANTLYYVITAGYGTNSFEFSATRGGTAVNTSGTQSGTHTLVFCPYGLGNGSTTFNVPDLLGRVPVGAGAGSGLTDRTALGVKSGEEGTTLTLSTMPSNLYFHTNQGGGSNNYASGGAVMQYGGGQAHNTMPPYLVLAYIIKH